MEYSEKFQGRFIGIMQWDDFENFWQIILNQSEDWFFYDLTFPPPKHTENIKNALDEIYKIIKELHQERYCGIIYTDDLEMPEMIKIFHPKNLGKACGSSESPPLPQWIFSKIKPIDLISERTPKKKSWFF
jgi:hypothetical protein